MWISFALIIRILDTILQDFTIKLLKEKHEKNSISC